MRNSYPIKHSVIILVIHIFPYQSKGFFLDLIIVCINGKKILSAQNMTIEMNKNLLIEYKIIVKFDLLCREIKYIKSNVLINTNIKENVF